MHRRRGLSHFRLCVAISAAFMVGILLNSWSILLPMDQALYQWSLKGCPAKILELTTTMAATHKSAVAAGLDPELGNPTLRKPKTAIVNFVRYHTEVVAVAVFHFVKLRHNVTVFTRDDPFEMGEVISPYFWKGFRKFERFFEHFHEYDNVVIATFPTCHDPTLRALLALHLPQRYIALVHNPEYLNSTDVSELLVQGDVRVLSISPHVGQYTRQILEAQGAGEVEQDWIAPMMPVVFPEDCTPGSWQQQQPACDRGQRWQNAQPPPAVLSGKRDSFCIQGKVDPERRNYAAIFAEVSAHRAELLAANLSVTILGKAGGRKNKVLLELPQDLVDAGLLRHYSSLPFQEYYEVLHSCIAVAPAFASDAYYVNKGSSSIGASLISGTPIISHRYMLKSYDFLEESAVFLADEPMSDVEAMLWVLSQPPEVRDAKAVGLGALRAEMYDRNLQVLQRMLGERYMYKHRVASGRFKGQYKPLYIDMSTPTKFSGTPARNLTLGGGGDLPAAAASDAALETATAATETSLVADEQAAAEHPAGGGGGEGGTSSRRKPQPREGGEEASGQQQRQQPRLR